MSCIYLWPETHCWFPIIHWENLSGSLKDPFPFLKGQIKNGIHLYYIKLFIYINWTQGNKKIWYCHQIFHFDNILSTFSFIYIQVHKLSIEFILKHMQISTICLRLHTCIASMTYLKVFEPTEYLNQLAMNTLKNILKMINKINLAELLVCSEKKIQWQKMKNIKRQVSFIKWMSAYRLQQSHWNKYEKGNTFIKSFLFNMLLMKYSFIFLKTYYILLH